MVWTIVVSVLCLLRIFQLTWQQPLGLELLTLTYSSSPYFLHVLSHFVLLRSRDSRGVAARAMRAYQRHASLLMQLNRQAMVLGIIFGLPHDVFT